MPKNNYFQFKQFRVDQNHAAMRVGTDGVLLGAWTLVNQIASALDIGTGTGLIALMLAQRSAAKIHAIDIEAGAIRDALYNFEQSKWSNRLKAQNCSIQDFTASNSTQYDCITCNPPFFNNAIKSSNNKRTIARHTDSLSYFELIDCVAKLLSPHGHFSVILPADQEIEFRNIANKKRLFPTRICRVRPNHLKEPKRALLEFCFEGELAKEGELILETEKHHVFTPEATSLLSEFYLKL